jgi:hypothetical protein
MPNLTVAVAVDRPMVIELLVAPSEARAEELRNAGLTVPLPILVVALIDTGAKETLIERAVVARLNLEASGARDVYGVGSGNTPEAGVVYRMRIIYAGVPALDLASSIPVTAVEDLSRFGVKMLLGRDLLSRCVLIYNGPEGRGTFAF